METQDTHWMMKVRQGEEDREWEGGRERELSEREGEGDGGRERERERERVSPSLLTHTRMPIPFVTQSIKLDNLISLKTTTCL